MCIRYLLEYPVGRVEAGRSRANDSYAEGPRMCSAVCMARIVGIISRAKPAQALPPALSTNETNRPRCHVRTRCIRKLDEVRLDRRTSLSEPRAAVSISDKLIRGRLLRRLLFSGVKQTDDVKGHDCLHRWSVYNRRRSLVSGLIS